MKDTVSKLCVHGRIKHQGCRRAMRVRLNLLDLVSFQRDGWDLVSSEFWKVRSAKKRNQGTLATVKNVRLVQGLALGRL